jgi:hypothetical protein
MLHGYLGLVAIALALATVGYLANYFGNPALKQAASGPYRFLFIPLGSGLVGLVLTTVLSLALTVFCFSQWWFFAFFPGINAAFELGGIGVLWTRKVQARA